LAHDTRRAREAFFEREASMAIEDFEWQAEVELGEAAPAEAVVERVAPKPRSWFARVRASVWLEPVLRLSGMGLVLAVLAAIGVVATTYAKPGLELPHDARLLTNALGTSWLKPTPEPALSPSRLAPAASAATQAAGSPKGGGPAGGASGGAPTRENAGGGGAGAGAKAAGVLADGRVVLNLASAEELTRLPGIGMKRAQAILVLRDKLKRFKQLSDLLRVKGIGARGLKRMLPHLVLDAP
jgi:competence protein ComEA